MLERLSAIDDAVVEGQALEAVGVHQQGRSEPAAVDVDVGRRALGHAVVHDLHGVARDAGRAVGALEDADVLVGASSGD